MNEREQHIGRGMSANRTFDAKEWTRILIDCFTSLPKEEQR